MNLFHYFLQKPIETEFDQFLHQSIKKISSLFTQNNVSKTINHFGNMNNPIITFRTFQPSKDVLDFISTWKKGSNTYGIYSAKQTNEIRTKSAKFQKDCLLALILFHGQYYSQLFPSPDKLLFYVQSKKHILHSRTWKLSEEDINQWAKHIKAERSDRDLSKIIPYDEFFKTIELLIIEKGKTPLILEALEELKLPNPLKRTNLNIINDKIDKIISGTCLPHFSNTDEIGKNINQFIENIPNTAAESWRPFLIQLFYTTKKASPDKKWIKQMRENTSNLDPKELTGFVKSIIQLTKESYSKALKQKSYYRLSNENEGCLCGLIWMAGLMKDRQIYQDIEEIAIKNWGGFLHPCLYAISLMPLNAAIPRLSKIKQKIKKPSIIKKVDKFILQYGKDLGKTGEEMEEIGVPGFGLMLQGERILLQRTFGEVQLELEVKGAEDFTWNWIQYNSKPNEALITTSARVPTKVSKHNKEEYQQLKAEVKEMESVLKTQRKRMEEIYLEKRQWTMKSFEEIYLKNPLLLVLARNLIWHINEGDKNKNVIFYQNKWQDENLQEVNWISENTVVSLWHPIESTAAHIFQWRSLLLELESTQPFAQAFREVYIVTDAELRTDTYSNRFAAHLIRQSLFLFLCKHKNWKYSWEITNKELKKWDIRAEFWSPVDYNSPATSDYGFHEYHHTDQVRFYHAGKQLRMEEVPAIVFSEIMREVDYFIGNTSIGADPNWQSGVGSYGYDYSQAYSFSDLGDAAKNRKEVLKALVPRLKIADKCSFEGKFLIVKGQIRTYKIHIGSGNILMTPNDQYLCIVADRSQNSNSANVHLPFEGDAMLSIILSKAFLLADDTTITDTTITSQIKRK